MRLFLLLALTPETGEATTVVAVWGIENKNQEVFWVDVPRIETAISSIDISLAIFRMSIEEIVNSVGLSFNGS